MAETSLDTIPTLTDEEIRARVGAQSFQRGVPYFRDHSVFDMKVQGMTLKARCHGSSGGPYRLHVTFGVDGIVDANCSCPVGGGGYCKHTAALLMTWRARPEEFRETGDLEATLEQRTKAELIALVKQMLRQEPELESLLEVPLPAAGRKGPVNPEVYRRQAASAFVGRDDDWGPPEDAEERLLAIASIGEGFARQGDHVTAAAVYEAIVLEAVKYYPEYHDETGSMGEVIYECVEHLGECLEHLKDGPAREGILRALFAVYRTDVEIGGVGLGDGAIELIFEHATPEEKHTIADWVRDALAQVKGYSESWARQAFGGMLLELEEDEYDDETFLRLCRETGRTSDLVDRLLALGRTQEAIDAAQRVGDYDLLHLADLFDGHEHRDVAERLVLERSGRSEDTRLLDWLKNRYASRGEHGPALDLAETLFHMRPDMTRYKELREMGRRAGRWETMRPELLASLREKGWNDLLVTISLEEGEIDDALAALHTARSPLIGYGYGLYGSQSLGMQVARAAAKTRPEAALEIYRQQVERLIAGRNRSYYAEAARLMTEMGPIYDELGDPEAWASYLEELRNRYRTLRALKEEMANAGL